MTQFFTRTSLSLVLPPSMWLGTLRRQKVPWRARILWNWLPAPLLYYLLVYLRIRSTATAPRSSRGSSATWVAQPWAPQSIWGVTTSTNSSREWGSRQCRQQGQIHKAPAGPGHQRGDWTTGQTSHWLGEALLLGGVDPPGCETEVLLRSIHLPGECTACVFKPPWEWHNWLAHFFETLNVFLVLKLIEGKVPWRPMIVISKPCCCHANNASSFLVTAQISWCLCWFAVECIDSSCPRHCAWNAQWNGKLTQCVL